ncbi:MAG: hypothetical protein ACUVTW_04935 [Thermogutta sp.]
MAGERNEEERSPSPTAAVIADSRDGARIHRALRRLTVAVAFLALGVFLLTAAVYGSLVNYFSGDALLFGGASIGAAILGFALGFFAGRLR